MPVVYKQTGSRIQKNDKRTPGDRCRDPQSCVCTKTEIWVPLLLKSIQVAWLHVFCFVFADFFLVLSFNFNATLLLKFALYFPWLVWEKFFINTFYSSSFSRLHNAVHTTDSGLENSSWNRARVYKLNLHSHNYLWMAVGTPLYICLQSDSCAYFTTHRPTKEEAQLTNTKFSNSIRTAFVTFDRFTRL